MRKLKARGHTVRIHPAQFVERYVKSNKNDMIDAVAIAEAMSSMRFVEVKKPRTVRSAGFAPHPRPNSQKPNPLVCQKRAFCFECGIEIHQGVGKFKPALPQVISDQSNGLTPTKHRLLNGLFEDLQ